MSDLYASQEYKTGILTGVTVDLELGFSTVGGTVEAISFSQDWTRVFLLDLTDFVGHTTQKMNPSAAPDLIALLDVLQFVLVRNSSDVDSPQVIPANPVSVSELDDPDYFAGTITRIVGGEPVVSELYAITSWGLESAWLRYDIDQTHIDIDPSTEAEAIWNLTDDTKPGGNKETLLSYTKTDETSNHLFTGTGGVFTWTDPGGRTYQFSVSLGGGFGGPPGNPWEPHFFWDIIPIWPEWAEGEYSAGDIVSFLGQNYKAVRDIEGEYGTLEPPEFDGWKTYDATLNFEVTNREFGLRFGFVGIYAIAGLEDPPMLNDIEALEEPEVTAYDPLATDNRVSLYWTVYEKDPSSGVLSEYLSGSWLPNDTAMHFKASEDSPLLDSYTTTSVIEPVPGHPEIRSGSISVTFLS